MINDSSNFISNYCFPFSLFVKDLISQDEELQEMFEIRNEAYNASDNLLDGRISLWIKDNIECDKIEIKNKFYNKERKFYKKEYVKAFMILSSQLTSQLMYEKKLPLTDKEFLSISGTVNLDQKKNRVYFCIENEESIEKIKKYYEEIYEILKNESKGE